MTIHLHRLLIALPLVLGACTTVPSKSATRASGKVDEPAISALYASLEQGSARYSAALATAAAGETARAQAEMKATLDDLQAATARCAALSGCDTNRFFSTYDHLLRIGLEGIAVDAEHDAGDAPAVADSEPGPSPLIASLPEMERTITLLKGRELADILVLNDPVKAGIEQWLTNLRPNLMTAYVNYQYMRHRMWPEYHKAGLPEALLFGMLAKESGGRVHAVSRAGASGPLQFMYATGLRFGLNASSGFDQRFDPGQSARANAAYLNEQLAIFNGNLELVIAAYNGGEGRMQRIAGRGGATSFWDPKIYAQVPTETRDYVPMVLAAAWLFLHPERYNLTFPKIDGRPGTLVLAQPATLAELTVCLGNQSGASDGWFRALRNLNPSLDHASKQPAGARIAVPKELEATYARSCVSGPWATLAADLHSATAATVVRQPPVGVARATAQRSSAPQVYKVRKGDSLAGITRKTGCGKIEELARLNGLRAPHYAIRAGQTLKMPACSAR